MNFNVFLRVIWGVVCVSLSLNTSTSESTIDTSSSNIFHRCQNTSLAPAHTSVIIINGSSLLINPSYNSGRFISNHVPNMSPFPRLYWTLYYFEVIYIGVSIDHLMMLFLVIVKPVRKCYVYLCLYFRIMWSNYRKLLQVIMPRIIQHIVS